VVLTDAAHPGSSVRYTSGDESQFAGGTVDAMTGPDEVAGVILRALPRLRPTNDAPAYAAWFAGLLAAVEPEHALPVSFADYFDDTDGWEVGWNSGLRYPAPPL
jgi:hypothetical protein